MLKLERSSDGERTTVRLIGRARSEHLGEIKKQMGSCGPKVTLDVEEVTVVDVRVGFALRPVASLRVRHLTYALK